MARFSFRLPDIGEGISEAEIVAWHVAVGDRVEEDGRLADMMTDKATVEMESPVAGVVVELAGAVGDQVPIGSTLVVIETDAGEGEAAPAAAAPGRSRPTRRRRSPRAATRPPAPVGPRAGRGPCSRTPPSASSWRTRPRRTSPRVACRCAVRRYHRYQPLRID